ncbi:hypothetical protein CLOSTMETH_00415 [[Clostridium] methylpentosum DSM 5476]|uniref:Uncharacterized protein n=1 Tax=[Clostridium] methylpentosum DSM 5476 TaxID=537013 RepID=C0E9B7_9FIRM|nr:hypothetical protein CLOSTMETH_00415 [[Clostridium] methylpentosum DSM 5476]
MCQRGFDSKAVLTSGHRKLSLFKNRLHNLLRKEKRCYSLAFHHQDSFIPNPQGEVGWAPLN